MATPLPAALPNPNAAQGNAAAGFSWLTGLAKRGDIIMALGIVTILVVLFFPIPAVLLDVGLAISLTLSVLILMVALFIEKPLDFSSFPTILLITTMIRLALNLASTKLILNEGHQGTASAGHVIEAFGNFLMSGNTVIGIIVFSILVIVNFIVITKGSGRIAEVSARFSLDAMPGKQMAIDADLSAGLVDEAGAKRRRKELEDESNFFGSMDGAAKFVRGDAIAGLLITFINVIGGIIIGVVFNDMPLAEAGRVYTFLTIGDGLVTQIPALIVSLAAGMLVTKSGDRGSTDKAVFKQLSGQPSALGMSSFLMATFAFLPGIPALPFLVMAGGTGYIAYNMKKNMKTVAVAAEQEAIKTQQVQSKQAAAEDEPISKTLKIDAVRLELGYGLLSLINGENGAKLPDQIKSLRKQLASEIGFIVPSVRIQDNLQLNSNTYVIRVKEIEAGRGDIRVGQYLVMDPAGGKIDLAGEPTVEPTFGLPALWVNENQKEEATFKGYTIVEPATVLITHLTEIIKDNMADLLSYSETQKLLDQVDEEHKKLVADVVPDKISVTGLQRVLQSLLQERVSVRDLPSILEGIAEATGQTRNLTLITEHVRMRLSRSISEACANDQGILLLVALSADWDNAFHDALISHGEDKQLAMAPSKIQEFMVKTRQTFEKHAMSGEFPALLTTPSIRPYVRTVIERFRPSTIVLSQNEIHPKARIKTVGQI